MMWRCGGCETSNPIQAHQCEVCQRPPAVQRPSVAVPPHLPNPIDVPKDEEQSRKPTLIGCAGAFFGSFVALMVFLISAKGLVGGFAVFCGIFLGGCIGIFLEIAVRELLATIIDHHSRDRRS